MTHVYANHVSVSETDTEIVLDFQLRGAAGKPEAVARIVLPPMIAAKLGLLLAPEAVEEVVAEQPKLEAQPKPKRSRKAKP